MKDLKTLTNIGVSITMSVALIGMAWSYGEFKKIEGKKEASREFEMDLLNLKMDLENDYKKRERRA